MNTKNKISKAILDAIGNVDSEVTGDAVSRVTYRATSHATEEASADATIIIIDNEHNRRVTWDATYSVTRDATNEVTKSVTEIATLAATSEIRKRLTYSPRLKSGDSFSISL